MKPVVTMRTGSLAAVFVVGGAVWLVIWWLL